MQVSCNVPYVLSVDGVEWVPIASAGGVDTYLLSVSGVVRIFIGGVRYFIFTNSIVADFSIRTSEVVQHRVQVCVTQGSYCQAQYADDSQMGVNVAPLGISPADALALGFRCTNGDIVSASTTGNWTTSQIANFDTSKYCAVFVGNVLIAFLEPIS